MPRRSLDARIAALEAALAARGGVVRFRSTPRTLSSPLKGLSMAEVIRGWLFPTDDANFNLIVDAIGAVLFREDAGPKAEALELAEAVDRLLEEGRRAEAEALIEAREPAPTDHH